jgi:HlyD family secretion protein
MNRKRNTIALVLLAAIAMVAMAAASGCNAQPTPLKPTPTAGTSGGRLPAGETIVADGRVRPARSADLTVAAAGAVTELLVAEGDAVKKDQPLLRLDSRRQTAALTQAEAALAAAKAAQAGAQAGMAKAQAALVMLKAGARSEDVAVARAAVQIAEAELNRVLAGADPSQFIAAKATMDKAARAVQQAQFAYDHSAAGTNGPEALRLEQATIDFEAAKGQYDQLVLLPRGADVAVARARLVQAQAALALAMAGPRSEAIKAAGADVDSAEAAANGAAAVVLSAEAAVAQARAALADTELRAPFDGIVAVLGVKLGETAGAGSIAVRLGDPSAWLVDTTDLTELNIVKLSEGSVATLTLDAIPGLTLTGKVSRIRPYGEAKQGDIVYTVTVMPDRQDPRLRWNMTAKVSLETR